MGGRSDRVVLGSAVGGLVVCGDYTTWPRMEMVCSENKLLVRQIPRMCAHRQCANTRRL